MSIDYRIRNEPAGEGSDQVVRHLVHGDREVAMFVDRELDETDAKRVVEAMTRYWDLLNAVKTLVFLVGQMPAAQTVHDQELNKAYREVSDFLREEHERRVEAPA